MIRYLYYNYIMPTSKCFMRYTNAGQKYKVCIDETNPDAPNKVWEGGNTQPYKYKEYIKVDDWLKDLGKTYTQLTEGQKREYMRLYMGNLRAEDRVLTDKAKKDLKKVKKELREEKQKEIEKFKQKQSTKTGKKELTDEQKSDLLSQAIKIYKIGGDISETDLKVKIGDSKYKTYIANTKNDNSAKKKRAKAIKDNGNKTLGQVAVETKILSGAQAKKQGAVYKQVKTLISFD